MPLGLTVTLLVLGGIVLAGIAGYLIEKSPEATKHLDQTEEPHKKP
jgi:hypothetical protein